MKDDEILVIAGKENSGGCPFEWYHEDVLAFARAIAAAEREACARVCELNQSDEYSDSWNNCAQDCAAAIRARSET